MSYDDLEIQLGNEVTKEQVKQEPKVQWQTETGAFYALEMIGIRKTQLCKSTGTNIMLSNFFPKSK